MSNHTALIQDLFANITREGWSTKFNDALADDLVWVATFASLNSFQPLLDFRVAGVIWSQLIRAAASCAVLGFDGVREPNFGFTRHL